MEAVSHRIDALPGGDVCRASGRGRIRDAEGQSFTFRVRYSEGDSAPTGFLYYTDSADGTVLRQATFTALICRLGGAAIVGTAMANGVSVPFVVDASGLSKTLFRISWPGYEGGGPLASGRINIRVPPARQQRRQE